MYASVHVIHQKMPIDSSTKCQTTNSDEIWKAIYENMSFADIRSENFINLRLVNKSLYNLYRLRWTRKDEVIWYKYGFKLAMRILEKCASKVGLLHDVLLVVRETDCSRISAAFAYWKWKGDLVAAILYNTKLDW